MQRKKNDVKARTTLLLSLPDEHQLRFSKYKTAKELWAAILKTFSGNEATNKRKKNLLKQQYGNFKAEASETLEQTFNRLQVIVSQLQFMDVEVEKIDLNQKFLTSLAPEWLMHSIVWRNRNDLDTMSLDDLYNHLKVYEAEPHDESNTKVPEGSGNLSSTDSSSNPPADQIETLTVESPIPTVSLSVPTACLNDFPKPSSEARLISKRVANQEETPSLDNILSLPNRFEDILGVTTSSDEAIRVEANVRNMETTISASSTPTLRIHKDHPKSQIIGPVDTPIQTRHKSKEVEEQSFIATIHQKTDPTLL
nr:ribonuclease H-like domain-containing protein [Tanacetum cinerariifolium]